MNRVTIDLRKMSDTERMQFISNLIAVRRLLSDQGKRLVVKKRNFESLMQITSH